jgi:hypothetical protein
LPGPMGAPAARRLMARVWRNYFRDRSEEGPYLD